MTDSAEFNPPIYLRNAYIQTILASNKVRVLGKNSMKAAETEMIMDAGGGIRLQGFFSPQPLNNAKGIAILLHGWEGSVNSTYILSTGRYLYDNGYAVFRLNYRDHGNSHHLNEGIFYAILLDEVFESVRQAAGLANGAPAFLAGFSMGGNFALRIAVKCISDPIPNLLHVAAVSPGLNPKVSTDAIDNDWLLGWYFLRKWRKSLRIKESLFPHLYDFSEFMSVKSCWEMTDLLLKRYSNYTDTVEYFKGYTLTGNALKDVRVPTTIITSRDDPIIPIKDFLELNLNSATDLIIHEYGGHNGFIESFPKGCWFENKLVQIFDSYKLG